MAGNGPKMLSALSENTETLKRHEAIIIHLQKKMQRLEKELEQLSSLSHAIYNQLQQQREPNNG